MKEVAIQDLTPWLLAVLLIEILIFGTTTPHFLSWANSVEIVRFSVELGLLAVALTPVIVSGGIDLSVGAMMGLAAISFGIFWQDLHLPVPIAAMLTLAVGTAGGAVNGMLIARLGVPALIVTLGSMALFRGVAEGLTEAAVSYSGFPGSFLLLGQGYLPLGLPAQLPIFAAVVAGYVVLLHRSIIGRALYVIGFNAGAARYAGVRVARRLALVYVLSGLVASLAAVIYVAHVGQARSDAGTGYELSAITAVLLGGASVAGGRGTIHGTLIGLFILAVLQNGLQLAALPSELTGVLTGAILIAAIVIDRLRTRPQPAIAAAVGEEVPVKNTQVAVLCGAVLAGSLIVAGTNVWLVRSLAGTPVAPDGGRAALVPARRPVIAMMPKAKGDPYFVSARKGAEEAAAELGVELIWDGPTSLDAAKQNDLVESWITRQVDAIAVAVQNPASISTVLRKARGRGITVLTWDADAEPDARDYFINQATPEGIGNTLTDEAARLLDGHGDFAVITGALSAANQNAWLAAIRQRLAGKHPDLRLVTVRPSDDDRDKAFAETQTILRAYPAVRLIMAIAAPAVPGAAEAVRQAGRTDVKVMGLSLPNINKKYVHEGVVQVVVLWNTTDLGYLTVQAATLAARGSLGKGVTSIQAGRLGAMDVRGSEVLLGKPLVMTKANIDQYDF
ncbi:MAG TPA: substrate-binding domain-containing protein [Vicinamibacterales bacterium]|nr:substrate-binding domain-containing protein [Vicinamibacterales bacterium]